MATTMYEKVFDRLVEKVATQAVIINNLRRERDELRQRYEVLLKKQLEQSLHLVSEEHAG
jgi:Tfp pilus assembly protein PilO